jgi:RNA polymerase sigma-70 factor (ECF subfamily)
MTAAGGHDEALMARAARDDRAALEQLVRRHATPLLTFLTRMAGDRGRAEEAFQETCLAVWRKRRQYEPWRPFKPWLYAIALNKCREAFRGRPPDAPLADDAPAAGGGPADAAAAAESADLVTRAVARLPERQRAVVTLRVWEGLPYARIAEAVGCSEATVRSHMHHALAALRRLLEKSAAGLYH